MFNEYDLFSNVFCGIYLGAVSRKNFRELNPIHIFLYNTLNHISQLSEPQAVTLVNKKAKLLNDLYMYQSNSYVSH